MEEMQVGQLQHPVRRVKEGIRRRLLCQQRQIAQAKGYIDLPAEELPQRTPVPTEQDHLRRIAGGGVHSSDELLRPGRHNLRLELEPLGVIPSGGELCQSPFPPQPLRLLHALGKNRRMDIQAAVDRHVMFYFHLSFVLSDFEYKKTAGSVGGIFE